MKKFSLFVTQMIFILLFSVTLSAQPNVSVSSPNGKIKIDLKVTPEAPFYSVAMGGKVLIKPSKLGFEFKNSGKLMSNFKVDDFQITSFEETWESLWGQKKSHLNKYNQIYVKLREKDAPNRILEIWFRAFDDGIAFRYGFPEQENLKELLITSEETEFNFGGNYKTWWNKANYDSYEMLYNTTPLNECDSANTPITMKTSDGIYLSVHEANLTDYAGMTLKATDKANNKYECNLVPWPDGIKVKAEAPHKTPWRTIQIADNAGGLIESSLIQNLNEPNKLENTSWIKPMTYVGVWWGMHTKQYTWDMGPKHGATTEITKNYIDFAAEHNIPGVLVEGWNTGWDKWGQTNAFDYVTPYSDFDIEWLSKYAADKGVYLIGHHETGGDTPSYEKMIDKAFALYKRLGIHAVKTGYAGAIRPVGHYHHGQLMVNHYRMVLEKCAEYELMLDAHEPIKPTGISRTYPNMMTREGVRGMEWNAWSDGNPPEHTVILPFTRGLGGPIDYTPGIFDITFDQYKDKERVHTTVAKQLALYVVIYSPLHMAADVIENYEGKKEFEFISKVPTDWNETKVLDAEIGDYVVIARRNGNNWYVGGITDENEREMKLKFDFLEKGKSYTAKIFKDGKDADYLKNPLPVDIEEFGVNSESVIDVRLASSGGYAIIITPNK